MAITITIEDEYLEQQIKVARTYGHSPEEIFNLGLFRTLAAVYFHRAHESKAGCIQCFVRKNPKGYTLTPIETKGYSCSDIVPIERTDTVFRFKFRDSDELIETDRSNVDSYLMARIGAWLKRK